jgi:hypothetical protein
MFKAIANFLCGSGFHQIAEAMFKVTTDDILGTLIEQKEIDEFQQCEKDSFSINGEVKSIPWPVDSQDDSQEYEPIVFAPYEHPGSKISFRNGFYFFTTGNTLKIVIDSTGETKIATFDETYEVKEILFMEKMLYFSGVDSTGFSGCFRSEFGTTPSRVIFVKSQD